MNILFIGDLVGSSGRKFLKAKLTALKAQYQTDLCIANAENAAAGLGLTQSLAHEIHEAGVDLLTMGNHTWSKRDFIGGIDDMREVVRPANGPETWPGRDHTIVRNEKGTVIVVNLLGRVYMDSLNDPFQMILPFLENLKIKYKTKIVVVDFHAEATSEKIAMGWYLDGQATLVAGTHTHVQTADERLLEEGTAYITDVGMTGPIDGIIGMDRKSSLRRFVERLPAPYEAARGRSALNAVIISVDCASGQARTIKRICWPHLNLTGE